MIIHEYFSTTKYIVTIIHIGEELFDLDLDHDEDNRSYHLQPPLAKATLSSWHLLPCHRPRALVVSLFVILAIGRGWGYIMIVIFGLVIRRTDAVLIDGRRRRRGHFFIITLRLLFRLFCRQRRIRTTATSTGARTRLCRFTSFDRPRASVVGGGDFDFERYRHVAGLWLRSARPLPYVLSSCVVGGRDLLFELWAGLGLRAEPAGCSAVEWSLPRRVLE